MEKQPKQVTRCLKQIRKHLDQNTLTNTAYSAIIHPKTGHIQCMIEACKANTPQGHTNYGLLDNNSRVTEELRKFYSIYPTMDTESTDVVRSIESYWDELTEFYTELSLVVKQKKYAPVETAPGWAGMNPVLVPQHVCPVLEKYGMLPEEKDDYILLGSKECTFVWKKSGTSGVISSLLLDDQLNPVCSWDAAHKVNPYGLAGDEEQKDRISAHLRSIQNG